MIKQTCRPVLFFLICVSIPLTATAQIVDIPDLHLRAVIGRQLGKASGDPITVADMETLTELVAFAANVSNLTGLEAATNLTSLNLDYNFISDISPLAGLTNLTILVLARNYIPDISAVAALTNLTRLELYENRIVDISPLAGLTKLEVLDLENNRISDLSPLVANTGLGNGDEVDLRANFLNTTAINTHIPALQSRGVLVEFDNIVIQPEAFAQIVDIPDPNLRAAIAKRHRKAPDEAITLADMLTLTGLRGGLYDISDLTGLETAINLTWLILGDNTLSDISPLAGLTNLTRLWLLDSSISDISPLAGLTNLTDLWLEGNSISDLSPLAGLINLTDLELADNNIMDISALAGLTNLTQLLLYNNNITDISPLAGLTNLTFLGLGWNSISDISSLAGLTNLTDLWLPVNSISDISPIAGLTNLAKLWIYSNSISDLSPLVENIGLGNGDQVDVQKNFLNAASINAHIPALQSRGVAVNYHNIIVQPEDITQIVDIPDPNLRAAIIEERGKPAGNTITVADMLILIELPADGYDISDLTGLEAATNLKTLSLRNNSISDLSPLVANVGVGTGDRVDVRGNFLNAMSINTHIPALQSRRVSVKFDNIVVRPDDIAQTVDIPDPNLRAAIAEERGKAPSDTITVADMLVLTTLFGDGSNISDLTGLEHATNLKTLWLNHNSISDISPLAALNNLTKLWLHHNSISDISALAGLTNLTALRLDNNSISDISPLTLLINLTDLSLKNNSISDISPVAGLNNLTRLTLSENIISDISSLTRFTKLRILWFDNNSISDISPLVRFTKLTELRLDNNSISDITPLIRLINLTELRLDNNSISDITPLIRLTKLTELHLQNNLIFDLSPLVENLGIGRHTSVDVRENPLNHVSIYHHISILQFLGVTVEFDDIVALTADVNGDGSVNIFDLVLVAGMLGNEGQNLMADVNGDGVVSIFDLILVAGMFDAAAAAPSAEAEPSEMLTAATIRGWLTDANALEIQDPIMKRGVVVLQQLLASLTPTQTQLLPNYPNPFNPETWIPYRLAKDAFVTLTIYDLNGQILRTIDVGHQTAAFYENRSQAIYWDGRNQVGEQVASGVYFYHLSAGDYSATRKMIILK